MRPKITFLILVFALFQSKVSGQCKTGVYSNFHNFLKNQPLPSIYVKIKKGDRGHKYINESNIDVWADYKIKKTQIKEILWGFCTDNAFYVSSTSYTHPERNKSGILRPIATRYSKILHYGRYSYFFGAEEITDKSAYVVTGLIGLIPIKNYYTLDMKTGNIQPVKTEHVRDIIADNPTLLEEFNNDLDVNGKLLEYIERYNEIFR